MYKTNLKIIPIYLLLLLLLFSGCQKKSGKLWEELGSQSLEPVTLTFYFPQYYDGFQIDSEVLDTLERMCKDDINVTLKFEYIDVKEFRNEKFIKLLKSGVPCDAFPLSFRWKEYTEQNLIADLTELLPRYAPNYYIKLSQDAIDYYSNNGKLYAIPNQIVYQKRKFVYVRSDLLQEFGIKEINNYNDLEEFCELVKKNRPDIIPLQIYESTFELFAEANGYFILDRRGGFVYKWDDPEWRILAWEETSAFKESILKINKWYKRGYIRKNSAYAYFNYNQFRGREGRYAAFILPFYDDNIKADLAITNLFISNSNESWKYKVFPFYREEVSERKKRYYGLNINTNSFHPERVIMFIEWFHSKQEYYDLLMYGIENKHYRLEGDRFQFSQYYSYLKTILENVFFRNIFLNDDFERFDSTVTQDQEKLFNESKENSVYAPFSNFIPDYRAVEKIRKLREDSKLELETAIIRGEFKESMIDEYIDKMRKNGSQQIVDVIQEQLDEWREENGL